MADKDFQSSGVPEVTRYEHDRKNIGAKKVSITGYDAGADELRRISAKQRADGTYGLQVAGPGLTPLEDYDYIDSQQTSATVETYVYKLGGSGGTTVLTATVTFTDATKAVLDYVEYA